MITLPDYIVLDFLEWISQNYPRNVVFLDLLLSDKEIVMSYAEEYLSEEYRGGKDYNCKQCKKRLKKYINKVIESKQFDECIRQLFNYNFCKLYSFYIKKISD